MKLWMKWYDLMNNEMNEWIHLLIIDGNLFKYKR